MKPRIHVPTLVIGLVCLAVGALSCLVATGNFPTRWTQSAFAVCLVVVGLIGLILAMRYRRMDHN